MEAHQHCAPPERRLGRLFRHRRCIRFRFADSDLFQRLRRIAEFRQAHIHLVHHVRKQGSERDRISKFDVKGSGSITDQVDNVLLVWRNKGKEQDDKRHGEPDALLTCDKQRNGEWEGSFSFWFHKGAMQFVPTSDGRTMDLLRLGE